MKLIDFIVYLWKRTFDLETIKQNSIRNYLKRKTKYLRHNLHINNESTPIKIIWLKNDFQIQTLLTPLHDINNFECYFLTNLYKFNNFNWSFNFDLIIVDLQYKVIETYTCNKDNIINLSFNKLVHIYVLPKNFINVYSIKCNDYVKPMYKF